ncbi:MAG: DUF177 domain-containing protein [Candidatus Omnitrophica bacterium]|nr:DUF177 domain-containing protein [Candidatus Omnitrophota bacterium]
MIIDITRLKDGIAESIAETLEPKVLDIEYVDLRYAGKIVVKGIAQKALHVLTFHGVVERQIEHTCARCLKTVQENIQEPIDFNYDIKDVTEVNMLDDIRDVLILSHSERFLCNAGCKGLCPNCGVDLNIETCSCRLQAAGHPFSKLRGLFNQKRS